jgi:hypothetical protein
MAKCSYSKTLKGFDREYWLTKAALDLPARLGACAYIGLTGI